MSEYAHDYESTETEDQVEEALGRIRFEVETIERHYRDQTDWPAWDGAGIEAIRLGHRLQACAINSRVGANMAVPD